MNLTTEQIQRVFALYFGTKRQGSQLLLKPISAITDEDAIVLVEILGLSYISQENNIHWVKEFLNSLFKRISNFSPFDAYAVFQYLIQQGYAVPLFIAPDHPLNGKTAIELNLALDVTTLPTKQPA